MTVALPFADRRDAGRELAARLGHYRGRQDVVVLGLARGGVPVAFEIAEALDTALDVFVVRKLGMPGHPEFAIGAIASGGIRVLNEDVVRSYEVPDTVVEMVTRVELLELERREREFRQGRPFANLHGAVAILVDDGLATGSTMRAAVEAVRQHQPARVVVAAPVGSPDACRQLTELADETVCARTPPDFSAVGQWYRDFSQTTDDEVRGLLQRRTPDAR